MSTSTSTSPLGDCVVCGKTTPTRCGECSKFGTDWIFFCSREHQKLVWFMHKRVCGKRSNPFTWPGYTKKEIDEMMELIKSPYLGRQPAKEGATWLEAIARPEFQNSADNDLYLKMGLESLQYAEDELPSSGALETIVRMRKLLCEMVQSKHIKSGTMHSDSIKSDIFNRPFDWTIGHQSTMLEPLGLDLPGDPTSIPSWSIFQHKFLFYHAIILSHGVTSTEGKYTVLTYLIAEIKRFCTEVIARTHRKEAEAILSFIATDG